jgi:probable rRNA maturation factor
MPPRVDIIEESPLWATFSELRAVIVRAVAAVAAHPVTAVAMRGDEVVTVALMDDRSIAELNRRWRKQSAPTNVLSFPSPPGARQHGPRPLGDIALSFETIEREARAGGKTMNDHVAHLVAHAMLHLLGYDHVTDRDAARMEALEVTILATMGIADPYETEAA